MGVFDITQAKARMPRRHIREQDSIQKADGDCGPDRLISCPFQHLLSKQLRPVEEQPFPEVGSRQHLHFDVKQSAEPITRFDIQYREFVVGPVFVVHPTKAYSVSWMA